MKQTAWVRNEAVGNPDCPVMIRSVLAVCGFSVRHHHFPPNHIDEHYHDHPWPFVTLVLRGSYTDLQPSGVKDTLRPGSLRWRAAGHIHRTQTADQGCTTLVFTGRARSDWGFWVDGRYFAWRTYRRLFRPPACAPSQADVKSESGDRVGGDLRGVEECELA